jgi:hypothetical protein
MAVTKRFPDRAAAGGTPRGFVRPMRRGGGAPAALAIAAALLAGCGGGGTSAKTTATATASTSTPAYCAALSDLEKSVKALKSTNVRKNGTDSLKAAVSQIQTDATAVVNQAKSHFAPETSALKNSVHTLSTSVEQLASAPSASKLAALPAQVSSVATASKNLKNAVSTKCP